MVGFRYLLMTISILLVTGPMSGRSQESSSAERPVAILLAAGDISKCGSQGQAEATARLLQAEIAAARHIGVDVRVLALGDLAYDNGTAVDFVCFGRTWGRQEIYPLLLPVPGNHEYASNSEARHYFDFFANLPVVANNRARGGDYALDLPAGGSPAWRIYALNSYAGVGASSAQMTWLQEDLQNHQAPCILAFWHPFLFSSGHHGHRDRTDPQAPIVRGSLAIEPFRVLFRQGATVVLTAHDHSFEQFGRHDVDGRPRPDGIRTFVVGTGGGRLYRNTVYTTRAPNSEAYSQDNYGILRIELYLDRYRWSFRAAEGSSSIELQPAEDRCNSRRQD